MRTEQLAAMVLKAMQECQKLEGKPLGFKRDQMSRVFSEEVERLVGEKQTPENLDKIVAAVVARRSEFAVPLPEKT